VPREICSLTKTATQLVRVVQWPSSLLPAFQTSAWSKVMMDRLAVLSVPPQTAALLSDNSKKDSCSREENPTSQALQRQPRLQSSTAMDHRINGSRCPSDRMEQTTLTNSHQMHNLLLAPILTFWFRALQSLMLRHPCMMTLRMRLPKPMANMAKPMDSPTAPRRTVTSEVTERLVCLARSPSCQCVLSGISIAILF